MKKVTLTFGLLAPRLRTQLLSQGISHFSQHEKDKLTHIQCDADSVARLHVRGVLNDSELHTIERRLAKRLDTLVHTRTRGGI